ncbi:MAG: penicillin-binding protein activator LpoB [Deltaproteobacteria bacterium]|nr:penicillin-binding protein activator LpoB [Deltaproteobacteria bacterium]MBI2501119.1 penicillin-binding protein activator LpoB [Deltaproteobacteria bacterium]MBI4196422.1 penicillin-binding protein activator LpoB [Deltaproteobacteria bacterium]
MMNRNDLTKIGLLFVIVFFTSCASTGGVYTKGQYVDADRVDLLSDKFVEADLQTISEQLTRSFLTSPLLARQTAKPAVIVSLVTNATDEHIDILSLTNKIRTSLIKADRFTFLNERLREAMATEYEYQQSGYVNPETAKQKGRQIGADWLISGHITSIKQPVGKQEIVYYKTTLEVTDLETSAILWADEVEIKKAFQKKRVRP